jgi:hypothetical protein
MGAIDPTRWQSWHFAWRIGATSFANVTCFDAVVDCAVDDEPNASNAAAAAAPKPILRHVLNPEAFITLLLSSPNPTTSVRNRAVESAERHERRLYPAHSYRHRRLCQLRLPAPRRRPGRAQPDKADKAGGPLREPLKQVTVSRTTPVPVLVMEMTSLGSTAPPWSTTRLLIVAVALVAPRASHPSEADEILHPAAEPIYNWNLV